MKSRLISILALAGLSAVSIFGATVAAPFNGSYFITDLGAAPGVTGPYGGLIVKAGDNNTLLIGGSANNSGGVINSVGLLRDGSGHITGFNGTNSLFSTAPNIDGGLAYAPNGVLLYTAYSSNQIGQIKPGSTTPDKIVTSPIASSVGALTFIPAGYNGAGSLVFASYSAGTFCNSSLADDGAGTYNLAACANTVSAGSGPEGLIYVPFGSPVFGATQTILVSDYGLGKVQAYTVNATGLPDSSTAQDFITGLSGAEGATIDPLSGDFLFSTFGGGNHVYAISGFVAPTSTPEPGTLSLLAGAGLALLALRRS